MKFRISSVVLFLLITLIASSWPLQAVTPGRLFILKDQSEILQYKRDSGEWILMNSYTEKEFPRLFPASSMEIRSGNILSVYDQGRNLRGRLHYDAWADALKEYQGDPGKNTDLGGAVLEKPRLGINIREKSSLYTGDSHFYRASLSQDEFRRATGDKYQDLFVLEGQVFGVAGDRIDQLSRDASTGAISSEEALVLSGSDLTNAAVSPWQEAFISDPAQNAIQRVHFHGGSIKSSGSMTGNNLKSPGSLGFNMDGELFVANGDNSPHDVLHFEFLMGTFTRWYPQARESLDLGGREATDLTLARPVGFVISEKNKPLVALSREQAGGHFGISQSGFIGPDHNSEAAIMALVEYGPGGHTPVHYHRNTEQIEVVLSGRALWEVGETEIEVGPGDVVHTGRWVKHGYKVLGDTPFKFLQLEWVDIKGK